MAWQDPQGQSEWRDAYGQYGQQGAYGQDPYGQQYAYGQDPYSYAQDPYAQYDYAAYGAPPVPVRSGTPGVTIAALIANIASAIFCCGIGIAWIPGIILAAIALSKNNTDPVAARKYTIGAWVCLGVDLILTVMGFMLLGIFTDSHSSSSY
jgi:hypothetical protein